jgi:hypothetical protein
MIHDDTLDGHDQGRAWTVRRRGPRRHRVWHDRYVGFGRPDEFDAAIEEAFGITLPAEDVFEMSDVAMAYAGHLARGR